jgi:hypothetical protein
MVEMLMFLTATVLGGACGAFVVWLVYGRRKMREWELRWSPDEDAPKQGTSNLMSREWPYRSTCVEK